jgi:amino acid transporter
MFSFHLALARLMSKVNRFEDWDQPKPVAGQEMPAEFGFASATFLVIAGMVGTGILATSGFTVLDVGSNEWTLWLWIMGGITAICGALTVAELSSAYLAGEIRHAQRLLPWAILLGTGLVIALYVALNIVYAFALSAAEVRAIALGPSNHAGREAVAPIAQIAAVRLFGPRWSAVFSIAFGMMLLSTLSAYVLIGPRVVYAMARTGQFPSIAAQLTQRGGTPAVATCLQAGVALILLWTGSFENLIIFAGVGLSLFSMLAVSSIYILRSRRPLLHWPFLAPGYPATPAVFLVVTGALFIATAREHPRVFLYAILSILAGVSVYVIWQSQIRFLDVLRQTHKLIWKGSTRKE